MREGLGVGDLVSGLQQRGSRLPFEIGAFVALEACEDLIERAVKVDANDVRVTTEGQIVLSDEASQAQPNEAAESLLALLQTLLGAAGPGVPPSLQRLVAEGGATEPDLRRLRDEIQASLIPLNRGASRRVLARLVRDASRAMLGVPTVSARQADAELDEFLERGREAAPRESRVSQPAPEPEPAREPEPEAAPAVQTAPTTKAAPTVEVTPAPEPEPLAPEPPKRKPARAPKPKAKPVAARKPEPKSEPVAEPTAARAAESATATESALATESAPAPTPAPAREPAPASTPAPATTPEPPVPVEALAPQVVPHDPVSPEAHDYQLAAEDAAVADEDPNAVLSRSLRPAARSRTLAALIVLIAALVLWWIAQQAIRPSATPATTTTPVRDLGAIHLTVDPPDAQVLQFLGRGPATIERLTAGEAHEFVAIEDGYKTTRVVIAEGNPWESTAAGPLYELAIQLPANDNGKPLSFGLPMVDAIPEPGDGRVRVVTNPPGAKVYRFVGRGPSVTVPGVSPERGHEFLVYRAGFPPYRAVIGPSDWRATEDGAREARLNIALSEKAPR